MKTIYILLTNTGTITSRLIRKFSDLEYTHSCISLDGYNFYSFSRKYTYLILPAGMVIENTDKGGLKRFSNRNCVLYKLDIEDKKYNKLDKVINKMMKNTTGIYFVFLFSNVPIGILLYKPFYIREATG